MPPANMIVFSLAALGLIIWRYRASQHWIEIFGTSGHRPEGLARVLEALRRAGVRYRTRNAVSLGTETTMGAGMSSTVLVHRSDLAAARRALAEHRAGVFGESRGHGGRFVASRWPGPSRRRGSRGPEDTGPARCT